MHHPDHTITPASPTTTDALDKTVDVYVQRIAEDAARAIAIGRGTLDIDSDYVERTLARLTESRATISAQTSSVITDLVRIDDDDIQAGLHASLTQLTMTVLTADIAIARLRRHLETS